MGEKRLGDGLVLFFDQLKFEVSVMESQQQE